MRRTTFIQIAAAFAECLSVNSSATLRLSDGRDTMETGIPLARLIRTGSLKFEGEGLEIVGSAVGPLIRDVHANPLFFTAITDVAGAEDSSSVTLTTSLHRHYTSPPHEP